jgi:hypothetical protein
MLSDSRGRAIISSLGWVDRDALWIMSAGSGRIESVFLSDAKFLSHYPGTRDFFIYKSPLRRQSRKDHCSSLQRSPSGSNVLRVNW